MPTDDSDLNTHFTAQDYLDVASVDSIYVAQGSSDKYAVELFKRRYASQTDFIGTWTGKTTRSPSLSPVYLMIFNRTTRLWEILAVNSTYGTNVNFTLSGYIEDNLSDYFDASNWVAFMVYQKAI